MSGKIIICRADEVLALLEKIPVAAVLSIEHPEAKEGRGRAPRLEALPQEILSFWDAEQKVHQGPDMPQVEKGILFALAQLEKGDVIVHCNAGKSRSAAVALGVLALRHPEKSEEELIEALLAIRPIAAPNIIIVEMADRLAGRGGKLLSAVENHPLLTAQRQTAEENRQKMIENRPDIAKKLFPEKFPGP